MGEKGTYDLGYGLRSGVEKYSIDIDNRHQSHANERRLILLPEKRMSPSLASRKFFQVPKGMETLIQMSDFGKKDSWEAATILQFLGLTVWTLFLS